MDWRTIDAFVEELADTKHKLSEARRELAQLQTNYSALGAACDEVVKERDTARWAAVTLAGIMNHRAHRMGPHRYRFLVNALVEQDWNEVQAEKACREVG